jgi:MFS family permease
MALGFGAVLAVQTLLTPAQLLAWGWRLPFLVSLPLGLAAFALRRRMHESAAFLAAPGGPGPRLAELIHRHPRTVVSGALLAGTMSVTVTLWFVYTPALLLTTARATPAAVLGPAVAGLVACMLAAPLAGRLSDRLGRPPVLAGACVGLGLLWPVAFVIAMNAAGPLGPLALVGANLAVGATLGGFVLAVYLPEAFAVRERATGVGLSYGVGNAVLGGLAPLAAGWLVAGGHLVGVGLGAAASAALALIALAWSARGPQVVVSRRTCRAGLSAPRR